METKVFDVHVCKGPAEFKVIREGAPGFDVAPHL